MAATEVPPSRLEAAKAAATAFVDKLPDTVNVGVVSFAGSSAVLAAPTTDHEAQGKIAALDPAGGGTATTTADRESIVPTADTAPAGSGLGARLGRGLTGSTAPASHRDPRPAPPPFWPAGIRSGSRVCARPRPRGRPHHRAERGTGSRSTAPAGSTEAAAQAILPSVVQLRTRQGSGSGVVIDDQGHVLTNHHVVAGSTTGSLLLSTGRRVTADVIGSNRDIAVLRGPQR